MRMIGRILQGDALTQLRTLDDESAYCCVTSPPYWGLRDYRVDGQIGLEATATEYVEAIVHVFAEVRRVLRNDGTLWLNLGDTYSGGPSGPRNPQRWPKQCRNDHRPRQKTSVRLKPKQLCGIPWRVAFALQSDGWHLRSDIIWSKPNPMPESVIDRPTKSHEYMFLFSKKNTYYYDADAVREPAACDGQSGDTRNKRDVWIIQPQAFPEAHFATFPPNLIHPCILAGCPEGGTVLDPFLGSGTTMVVAAKLGRNCVGIDIKPEYIKMAKRRVSQEAGLLMQVNECDDNSG